MITVEYNSHACHERYVIIGKNTLPRFDACCQDSSVIERFEIKAKARESLSPVVKHVEAIITALIAAMQANSCRLVTISQKRNKCKIHQTSKYTVLYVKKKWKVPPMCF